LIADLDFRLGSFVSLPCFEIIPARRIMATAVTVLWRFQAERMPVREENASRQEQPGSDSISAERL
jgi:hypothetical protein